MPPAVRDVQQELDTLLKQDSHGLGLVRHQRVTAMLQLEANRHSVEMEHMGPAACKTRRAAVNAALERQSKAWTYATKTVAKTGLFSTLELAVIAKILIPGQPLHPITGYRMDEVRVSDSHYARPSPMKLPEEMMRFFERLSHLSTPLEKAIFSHYHLARIHPFIDGNGRTARTVQNALLCAANYVPIAIAPTDRSIYFDALEESHIAYREKDSQYIFPIAQFLTERFAEGIHSYRASIPKSRRATVSELHEYCIQVSGVTSRADWIAISKHLKDYARSIGSAIAVQQEKPNGSSNMVYLRIRGPIETARLDSLIGDVAQQRDLSYDIFKER